MSIEETDQLPYAEDLIRFIENPQPTRKDESMPTKEEFEPICIGCQKHPDHIGEYIDAAAEEEVTPAEYVRMGEGTYNPRNGHFLCTSCYIKAGQPLGIAP